MAIRAIENLKAGNIPYMNNDMDVFFYVKKHTIDWNHLLYLKEISSFSDDIVSDWLNISVKTLRAYRKPETQFKDNLKEHIVLILSLYDHGIDVFETKEDFDKWLNTDNFYFDNKRPKDYLDTISGIKFIDDRLTAIEYGDNV